MSGMVAAALDSITSDWDSKVASGALEQLIKDASPRAPKG